MLAFTRDIIDILDCCKAYGRTLSLIKIEWTYKWVLLWGELSIDETLLCSIMLISACS